MEYGITSQKQKVIKSNPINFSKNYFRNMLSVYEDGLKRSPPAEVNNLFMVENRNLGALKVQNDIKACTALHQILPLVTISCLIFIRRSCIPAKHASLIR